MFHVANAPNCIAIDFTDALVIDHSAVAAIQGIGHRFEKVSKAVLLLRNPKVAWNARVFTKL